MRLSTSIPLSLIALGWCRRSVVTAFTVKDVTLKSLVSKRISLSTSTILSSSDGAQAESDIDVGIKIEGPALPPISPTAKRLFLVRHGEVINPGGDRPVYYGAMDVPLSPLGELEAKAAGMYLQQMDLQHIAASPLSRAIYGANQVKDYQAASHELKVYPGFTELDRGDWCGKTKGEIGDEMMNRFDACDESVTPEGGESYPTLKKRVLEARDELLSITDCGKASAVVSHLQVTRSMLSEAMGIPTEEMAGLKIATASITCIDYDSSTSEQIVHFQSFKPEVGLQSSRDGAN